MLEPASPGQEVLKTGLIAVATDLQTIEGALMQILDGGGSVSPAWRELSDQLVTKGMESFAKLAAMTSES